MLLVTVVCLVRPLVCISLLFILLRDQPIMLIFYLLCYAPVLIYYAQCYAHVKDLCLKFNCFIRVYRISSIITASLISTAVWYYSNTNNIEFNVYFNSNAPSNNTV